jgi:hypothetical protein
MNLTSLSTVINKKVRTMKKVESALRKAAAIQRVWAKTMRDMEAFRERHYTNENNPL